jgi:tRNA threonylcarbamoyladenosine biosynthesis protein TsaB
MKLLALDTATEACSVAVVIDGEYHEHFELGRRHSEGILVMVEAVLADAGLGLTQLDAIAFGRGPGLFTGLRIGAGVTQGLAFAAGLPVVPVSSLAALAQSTGDACVLAAIDARMNQVYWGAFVRGADGLVELVGNEAVSDPAQVPVPSGLQWVGAGSGWDRHHEALRARLDNHVQDWRPEVWPRARNVAALGAAALAAGGAVSPEQAAPVYIRDDVAVKSRSPGAAG